MDKNPVSAQFEERLREATRMPAPEPEFVAALWQKLEASQAGRRARGQGLLRAAWQWGVGLATLAALVGLLVFSMKLLPGNVQPAAADRTPTLDLPLVMPSQEPSETPAPTITPIPAPTSIPIPNRLVEGACNVPVSQAFAGLYAAPPGEEAIEQLAGGGSVESGPFTFELWLACGSMFHRQTPPAGHYSEIDGLGLMVGWRYQGAASDKAVEEHQGFEPFVEASNTGGGVLSEGSMSFSIKGISFPWNVLPDFSAADTPLRYIIQVRAPDGALAGAALAFTLQRQPKGYQLVDVRVEPLSAEELQRTANPAAAQPPFATLDPGKLYPELKTIQELVERYQAPLRASPGWVHVKTRYETPGRADLYANQSVWLGEEWLQVDAHGEVATAIRIDRSLDGQTLRQVYSKDGETHDLTDGTRVPYTPARLELSNAPTLMRICQLQASAPLGQQEITVAGKPALAFFFTDRFAAAAYGENGVDATIKRIIVIDPQSGAELYSELVQITADGQEALVWRMTYELIERIAQPPEDVLALLRGH